jgi:hypothetical protein
MEIRIGNELSLEVKPDPYHRSLKASECEAGWHSKVKNNARYTGCCFFKPRWEN